MTDDANEGETEKQQRQRLHDAQRSELLDRQRANADSYDKSILTLASGSLALSLSFIKDTLPPPSVPAWTSLLYSSWFLLSASIITTVASFLLSHAAIDQALKQTTEYYIDGNESAFANSRLARAVSVSNVASGLFFILGIVLTVAFVSVNFHEVRDVQAPHPIMQKVVTGGAVEKGQPIPQMQPITKPTPAASAPSAAPTSPSPPKEITETCAS